jgi:hypothetical protein
MDGRRSAKDHSVIFSIGREAAAERFVLRV